MFFTTTTDVLVVFKTLLTDDKSVLITNKMNWNHINQIYENEIHFFKEKTDKLFFDIVTLETELTKKKQQKLQQDEEDLDRLFKLIVLFLESVALINTYEYFKMKKILLTNEKLLLFKDIFNKHFENLLQVMILKIKNEESIDFTIN